MGGVGAVVLDLNLPDSHGVETFDKLFQASSRAPILILSEADAEDMARQAVKRGAQNYVVKNQFIGDRLRGLVRTMIDRRDTEAVVETLVLQNEVAKLTSRGKRNSMLKCELV